MKRKMFIFIALGFALLYLTLASGCGGSSSSSTTGAGSTTTNETTGTVSGSAN